jgi:hypothetical protein
MLSSCLSKVQRSAKAAKEANAGFVLRNGRGESHKLRAFARAESKAIQRTKKLQTPLVVWKEGIDQGREVKDSDSQHNRKD